MYDIHRITRIIEGEKFRYLIVYRFNCSGDCVLDVSLFEEPVVVDDILFTEKYV